MGKDASPINQLLREKNTRWSQLKSYAGHVAYRMHQRSVYHRYDKITKKHATCYALKHGNPLEALTPRTMSAELPSNNELLKRFSVDLFRYYYNLVTTLQIVEDDALASDVRRTAIQVGIKQLYSHLTENQRSQMLNYFQKATEISTLYKLLCTFTNMNCLDDMKFWGFHDTQTMNEHNEFIFGFLDQLILSMNCVISVLAKKDKKLKGKFFVPIQFNDFHSIAMNERFLTDFIVGLARNYAITERQKVTELQTQERHCSDRLSMIGDYRSHEKYQAARELRVSWYQMHKHFLQSAAVLSFVLGFLLSLILMHAIPAASLLVAGGTTAFLVASAIGGVVGAAVIFTFVSVSLFSSDSVKQSQHMDTILKSTSTKPGSGLRNSVLLLPIKGESLHDGTQSFAGSSRNDAEYSLVSGGLLPLRYAESTMDPADTSANDECVLIPSAS